MHSPHSNVACVQYTLVLISLVVSLVKYAFNVVDARSANGWDNKGAFLCLRCMLRCVRQRASERVSARLSD